MNQPNHFLAFLEGLSYVSTFLLLIVATIGLRQLKISKDESRLNARRDASRVANEQIKHYSEKIIPLINDFDTLIRDNNIKIFKQSSFKIVENGVKIKIDPKGVGKEFTIIANDFTKVNNAFEGFASYFISGLADEQVAFKAVGATYCHTVKDYLPLLVAVGGNTHYQNLIDLFLMWNTRLDKQALASKKEDIERQLKKMDGKEILPIGAAD